MAVWHSDFTKLNLGPGCADNVPADFP